MFTADSRHRARSSTWLQRFGPVALTLASLGVSAQSLVEGEGEDPRRFSFTPNLSITESIAHRRPDVGASGSESITTIAPGFRLLSRAGRVQGSIDYSLGAQYYSRSSAPNGLQHRLAAQGVAEAIQDHLYVDFFGNVERQPISALGVQSAVPGEAGRNYTDVRTFSVSPVLRGVLAGAVDVQARALASSTSTGATSASNSTHGKATLHFGSIASPARFGWSFDASRDVIDFDLGRRTEEDRLVAGLLYRHSAEFRLTVRGGTENSDVASREKKRVGTYGTSILWTPSARTQLAADYDKRVYGHSHAFNFEHRMKRSVWRYADSQALTTQADAGIVAVPAFELFSSLFQSAEPDPVLRQQLVDAFLAANNLQRGDLIRGGFLTGGSALVRTQELSFAVEDVRTTYVLSAFATRTQRAFQVAGINDDLRFGALRQRGLSLAVSHRVSQTARANLLATTQRSSSESVLQPSGRLSSVIAGWSDGLTRRTDYSLSLRYSTFSSGASGGYKEIALVGGLNFRF